MITLGITGRSGCGKSTVTAVFAAHGVPLADADQLSREILLPGSPLLPQLAARFGGDILHPDGTLDRRLLADRAFATPEGKAALDSLTHPAIVARIRAAKQAAQTGGTACAVLNGANETAVAHYLRGECGFYDIPRMVDHALQTVPFAVADTLETVLQADRAARAAADSWMR